MTDIKWVLDQDDIEWEMDWEPNSKITGKRGKEMIFESEKALAHLLMNEVVYTNSYWWKFAELTSKPGGGVTTKPKTDPEWTEADSKLTSVHVNCNDVFAWGCADSESLPHKEIENVYRMWRKDPEWGPAVWCMIQRNQMPQKPVEDRIRKAGIWDLDALKLGENTMDAEVQYGIAMMVKSGALGTPSA